MTRQVLTELDAISQTMVKCTMHGTEERIGIDHAAVEAWRWSFGAVLAGRRIDDIAFFSKSVSVIYAL